jgi:hypothetical protein
VENGMRDEPQRGGGPQLIKREWLEQKNIAKLIDVLASPAFRSLVASVPGYDAIGAGNIRTISKAADL